MSGPTCYGSLQVCAMRAALLGTNGQPIPGAANGYVSEALITVNVGIELEDGADVVKKNGCGRNCQNYQGPPQFKRANLGLALCELDIQVGQLLVGGDLIPHASSGDFFGWQFPGGSDDQPSLSLEFWTKAWDGGSQATPDSTGNDAAYWHWVFTKSSWALDDMTAEDDFLEFAVTGVGTENPNMPAHGPFDDWPADLAAFGGFTKAGGIFLDSELPTQTCDFIEVPAIVS